MNVRVVVLTLLVAASSAIAYWLSTDEKKSSQAVAEQTWLSELARYASSVNSVTIENNQGLIFSAKQENGTWEATHLDSQLRFPVDRTSLAEMVTSLAQAKVLETKTSNAQNYRRLGVESVEEADAQSTRIILGSPKQQWEVLIGNVASSGLGNYVRQPKQRTSYLIDQVVALPDTAMAWLQSKVLPFGVDDLSEVLIQYDDQPPTVLQRRGSQDEQEWQLSGAKDATLAYPGVLAQTAAQLTDIGYEKVMPYLQNQWEAEQLISDVTYTLVDGSQVFAYVAKADENGLYKTWFSTPDSPSWISDWVLLLSEYQVAPFLTTREQLLNKSPALNTPAQ